MDRIESWRYSDEAEQEQDRQGDEGGVGDHDQDGKDRRQEHGGEQEKWRRDAEQIVARRVDGPTSRPRPYAATRNGAPSASKKKKLLPASERERGNHQDGADRAGREGGDQVDRALAGNLATRISGNLACGTARAAPASHISQLRKGEKCRHEQGDRGRNKGHRRLSAKQQARDDRTRKKGGTIDERIAGRRGAEPAQTYATGKSRCARVGGHCGQESR